MFAPSAYCDSSRLLPELFCIFQMKLVLGCARKSDITLELSRRRWPSCILGSSDDSSTYSVSRATAYFFDLFYNVPASMPSGSYTQPCGIRRIVTTFAPNCCAFSACVDCYISGTGDTDSLACQLHAIVHLTSHLVIYIRP